MAVIAHVRIIVDSMTSPYLTDTQFWVTGWENYFLKSRPGDVPKTAVIRPFGLFEFLRMPFGLKNAGLHPMRPGFFICVLGRHCASRREHLTHLQLLFARLGQHGLIINPAKCQFGLAASDFLGHRITSKFPYQTKSMLLQSSLFPTQPKHCKCFWGW